MRLIIAEKPSVAQAIRDVLPSSTDIRVTHCYGHMLELAEPAAYNPAWAKWNLADLPIKILEWKLERKPSAAKQLGVIRELMKQAREIIHAGDPDREGQLLVDEVLDHFRWKGPVQRLLINAADPDSVRKALAKLEPNAKYQGLRHSAECRQRADWLVGMNLTRAVTKLLSPDTWVSIGRVQTPTLALVVRRHLAIKNFASQGFFTFRGLFNLDGGRKVELRCEPDPRITDEQLAKTVGRALQGHQAPLSITTTSQQRLSPLPYHLGDFQKAAERHYGWSIARSLEALQAAYEAKLTSYPRVDCRYLPAEQMGQATAIAGKVAAALSVAPATLALMAPKKRVYDTNKVEVHHGIVPTGLIPAQDVSEDARKAWKLVSLHFLRTLLPDEQFDQTVVAVVTQPGAAPPHETLTFHAKAERVTNPGQSWTAIDLDALLPPVTKGKPKEAPPSFPVLHDGESATLAVCEIKRGKTEPPKPYTEATLREDMSSVAKYAEDPRVKAILKETSGIGTPATQANIIETLKTRGYIQLTGKRLEPTELGIEIIRCVPKELADPAMTAAWEDALNQVASGTYEPALFMGRVDALVERRIQQAKTLRDAGVAIKAAAPSKGKAKAPGKKSTGTGGVKAKSGGAKASKPSATRPTKTPTAPAAPGKPAKPGNPFPL